VDIGIWGMGRMGFNMVRRLVDRGEERVIAGNRSPGKVDEAVERGAEGAYSVEEFVGMQESPRVLWTMLPAGDVTDDMIHQFMEFAGEGDIIVDGANSYFRDSVARAREVRNAGLRWLDAGVSGGVWGYDVGYCTMIGGDADAFEYAEPAFETLAPPNGYAYLGDAGAGHFAKMELAESAFEKDANLDSISGYVEDSGEGRWTVLEAIEEDVPANAIAGSLFARFASRQDDSFAMKVIAALRGEFGGHAIKEAATEQEK
jgi:6-phosphogluconate dehydrogenase